MLDFNLKRFFIVRTANREGQSLLARAYRDFFSQAFE